MKANAVVRDAVIGNFKPGSVRANQQIDHQQADSSSAESEAEEPVDRPADQDGLAPGRHLDCFVLFLPPEVSESW